MKVPTTTARIVPTGDDLHLLVWHPVGVNVDQIVVAYRQEPQVSAVVAEVQAPRFQALSMPTCLMRGAILPLQQPPQRAVACEAIEHSNLAFAASQERVNGKHTKGQFLGKIVVVCFLPRHRDACSKVHHDSLLSAAISFAILSRFAARQLTRRCVSACVAVFSISGGNSHFALLISVSPSKSRTSSWLNPGISGELSFRQPLHLFGQLRPIPSRQLC